VEIREIGEVVLAAITTTTVNTQVTPSFSVSAHTSDRPLQQQQQQQQKQKQNESRPIMTATPAPQ